MDNKGQSKKWYALFVITGEEDKVKERLKFRVADKDLNIMVPKRELRERKNGVWVDKLRPLFPGYILLNGHIGIKEYYSLKGVPGVLRVLRDNAGLLEIKEEEIYVISKLIGNCEVIGCSNVMIEGNKVEVIDGPLLGLEGLIASINKRKGRAKVRFNFAGEQRLVELSVKMVNPI